MVLENVKRIGGGKPNKCFDNAYEQKVKAKNEGKDVMCISGWLVQPYNLKTRSVAIIQHWWNVDENQNHFDTTPIRSDEEYILDFELYEFARINHDLISSNIGRSLLYQNGKFELLIDEEKMLFLAGPRQVGKTTLAQTVLNQMIGLYLNYDIQSHRKKIREGFDLLADLRVQSNFPMIVFDEIHKLNKFKSYLKGFYDENRGSARIWVTGSGRLDLYQKGGDSLLGRYFLYHIHPFTISDLQETQTVSLSDFLEKILKDPVKSKKSQYYQDLLEFGGFPEPFLKKDKSFYHRWIKTRKQRLIQEDIRDLTRIQDLNRLEQLVDILPSRVGSPLSIQLPPIQKKSQELYGKRRNSIFGIGQKSRILVFDLKILLYPIGKKQ